MFVIKPFSLLAAVQQVGLEHKNFNYKPGESLDVSSDGILGFGAFFVELRMNIFFPPNTEKSERSCK
jgi:hypothetical protein